MSTLQKFKMKCNISFMYLLNVPTFYKLFKSRLHPNPQVNNLKIFLTMKYIADFIFGSN